MANEYLNLWYIIALAVRLEREGTTPFCARMSPENPDRSEAAEEPVIAAYQGIAQLWRELLGRQQGP